MWFEKLWQNTVDLFRSMDIPVRTIECCSGDLADLKVKSYDVEAFNLIHHGIHLCKTHNTIYYRTSDHKRRNTIRAQGKREEAEAKKAEVAANAARLSDLEAKESELRDKTGTDIICFLLCFPDFRIQFNHFIYKRKFTVLKFFLNILLYDIRIFS